MRCIIVENKRIIVICTGHNHDFPMSALQLHGSRQSKIQPYRPNVNFVNVRRRWNGINGGIMQITKQTHVTNLTMFTSAVAQLYSANALSICILYENKLKLI